MAGTAANMCKSSYFQNQDVILALRPILNVNRGRPLLLSHTWLNLAIKLKLTKDEHVGKYIYL